jgi:hypothetical protein
MLLYSMQYWCLFWARATIAQEFWTDCILCVYTLKCHGKFRFALHARHPGSSAFLKRLRSVCCLRLMNMASPCVRASVRRSDGGSWNSSLGSDRNGRSRRVRRASTQSRSGPTLEWECCGQLCRRVRSNVGRVCLLLIYLERVDEPVGVCESCRIIADEICARVGAVGVGDLWTGSVSIIVAHVASGQVAAEVGVDDDVVVYEVCVDVAGRVRV